MAKKEIIKYQWTDKQQNEVLEILAELKRLVYQREIWDQVEESPQHDKHTIRGRVDGMIKRVKEMRKITEEWGKKLK
ncbi:MAG: hypothetical protein I3273_04185 [Candidatus Moeniiplasma glomeromycotorum]|nr:hypothetical protein [Candidatus Moeniiplasma glomeromycotorum]